MRPRMSTRRWMVLLVVVALILAVGRCLERRAYYLRMARRNAPLEHLYGIRRNVELETGGVMYNPEFFKADGTIKEEYAREFAKSHRHFAALVKKYRYAASHPWVYVEPDPPEPK